MAQQGATPAEAASMREEIATLKQSNKDHKTALKTVVELGKEAVHSKTAFNTASLHQLMRQLVMPGTEVAPSTRALMKHSLQMTDRQLTKEINKFKNQHPEYKKGTHDYNSQFRKRPMQKPKNALRQGMEGACLQMKSADAKKISKMMTSTVDVMSIGMHQSDARLTRNDAFKFVAGSMLAMGSPNAKTRTRGFNGKATRRPQKDTP